MAETEVEIVEIVKKKETPQWMKLALAALIAASSAGGVSFIPINYNAKVGYESVQEAYPDAMIEVRSWRPYIMKVKNRDGSVACIVETSLIDGTIIDRWCD